MIKNIKKYRVLLIFGGLLLSSVVSMAWADYEMFTQFDITINKNVSANSSADMVGAINTTDYYQFQSKNSSIVYNASYETLDFAWTGKLNVSGNLTSCSSGQILKANATGQWGCNADAGETDTDTNATTECSGDQVLIGGGSCLSLLTDWNFTYNVSYDSMLGHNTSAEILALIPADTNATSICGDNTVLGGGGTCLTLSTYWNVTYNQTYDADSPDVYVNASGDTMSGNLNMGNQNITYVENITFSDGTTPDAMIYFNGTILVIAG